MPVQVHWENSERTIIRLAFRGETCLEDYFYTVDEVVRLARQVTHSIHVIIDRTEVTATPVIMFDVIKYAHERIPANVKLGIVVRPSMFTRLMLPVYRWFSRLATPLFYVDELVEAHLLIEQYALHPLPIA